MLSFWTGSPIKTGEAKMRDISGGCLCGQVRYSAHSEPAFMGVCHCKNCQKQTGTAFSVVLAVPKSALSIQGQLKTYRDTGDSGQPVLRSFCPDCGSPITTDVALMPDLTIIKSWLDPKMHIFCDSAQRWSPIPASSHQFPKGPPAA
jgi:hypothetical protein